MIVAFAPDGNANIEAATTTPSRQGLNFAATDGRVGSVTPLKYIKNLQINFIDFSPAQPAPNKARVSQFLVTSIIGYFESQQESAQKKGRKKGGKKGGMPGAIATVSGKGTDPPDNDSSLKSQA